MANGMAAEVEADRTSEVGPRLRPGSLAPASPLAAARLRFLVRSHLDFIWRNLRRMGLSAADADDGCQEVFTVAARRLGDVRPGRERAFLYGVAYRVASEQRRRAPSQHELLDEQAACCADPRPGPEQLLEQRRARALLDQLLDALELEQRAVFVLYELEQLSVPEIASLLEVPLGTAASRLRRARHAFELAVQRLRARQEFAGRSP